MGESKFKALDPEYSDDVFTELVDLEILLDADPLIYGPKRLNGKIALARKMLARCERLFLDVSQRLSQYKRGLRSAVLILDLEKKHLLANDPEVRAGRAVSERDAIASGKLKDEVLAVANNQHAVEDLEAVLTVVKAKRSDLRDTQGRLRDQIRLCQEEIGLSGRWGSKSPRGTELEPGQGFADGRDVQDVDDLIQDVRAVSDAETHMPADVDGSDPELEQEADLAGTEATDPVIVSGEDMAEEVGFVPYCAVCGEKQHMVIGSGMCCINGHGGADSTPKDETLSVEVDEPEAATVLPGTVKADDVAGFLDSDVEDEAPLSRREIEEADVDIDIDSILSNFAG